MPGTTPSLFARPLAAGVLAAALVGVVWAAQWFVRDLQFTSAATEASFWGRGEYKPLPATVEHAASHIEQLLLARPGNPGYLELQANTLAWRAYWANEPKKRKHYMRQAVAAQSQALEYRPAHPQSWAKLINYNARANGGGEVYAWAQQRLAALQRWVEPTQVN